MKLKKLIILSTFCYSFFTTSSYKNAFIATQSIPQKESDPTQKSLITPQIKATINHWLPKAAFVGGSLLGWTISQAIQKNMRLKDYYSCIYSSTKHIPIASKACSFITHYTPTLVKKIIPSIATGFLAQSITTWLMPRYTLDNYYHELGVFTDNESMPLPDKILYIGQALEARSPTLSKTGKEDIADLVNKCINNLTNLSIMHQFVDADSAQKILMAFLESDARTEIDAIKKLENDISSIYDAISDQEYTIDNYYHEAGLLTHNEAYTELTNRAFCIREALEARSPILSKTGKEDTADLVNKCINNLTTLSIAHRLVDADSAQKILMAFLESDARTEIDAIKKLENDIRTFFENSYMKVSTTALSDTRSESDSKSNG